MRCPSLLGRVDPSTIRPAVRARSRVLRFHNIT
jgi:hypothetical protein